MILPNSAFTTTTPNPVQKQSFKNSVQLLEDKATGMRQWIINNPGLSVAAAVAVGLTLGWIIRR